MGRTTGSIRCMDHLLSRPILIGVAVAALLLGAGAFFVFGGGTSSGDVAASISATPSSTPSASASATPSASPTLSPSPTPSPIATLCPLSGMPVGDAKLARLTPIVVQIENHPAARPARNLNSADMVFEATVEGDATRFSAVYLCQPTAGLTGPVRSARYYNIDLWQDVHLLPVGFGASNGALERFAAAGMPYVNGITGGWPWYQRTADRVAPHNLYADLEKLRSSFGSLPRLDALAAKVGALRPPFRFDPDAQLPTGKAVSELTIQTNPYWRFGWSWNATGERWERQDAGKPISDAASGDPVSARSVVVQRVTEETVYGDPDPGGNPRKLQHLVGRGAGTLYVNGRAIAVHWSRPTAADATKWTYAADGSPVVLPPGRVWWEIVPVQASVSER